MLNSAIGAYYYLRITVSMYFGEPTDETVTTPVRSGPATVGMYIALVFTVLLGIFPMLWFNLLQSGVTQVASEVTRNPQHLPCRRNLKRTLEVPATFFSTRQL